VLEVVRRKFFGHGGHGEQGGHGRHSGDLSSRARLIFWFLTLKEGRARDLHNQGIPALWKCGKSPDDAVLSPYFP